MTPTHPGPAARRRSRGVVASLASGMLVLMLVAVPARGAAVSTAPTPDRPALTHGVSQGANPCKDCKPACKDGAFRRASWRIPDGTDFEWYFNPDSTPTSGVSETQAEDAFLSAMQRLEDATNDCGLVDTVGFDASYMGTTTSTSTITDKGKCKQVPDGTSVVDFGKLPKVVPAITCVYIDTSGDAPFDVVEADTRIRRMAAWTTDPKGPGCTFEYDLEGLATHEFGHIAGLAHVSKRHGNQTMSVFGLPNCSTAYRTWGKGDIRGLRALY
jgi:hypothetical protein